MLFWVIFMLELNEEFRDYEVFNDRSLVYSWDKCFFGAKSKILDGFG